MSVGVHTCLMLSPLSVYLEERLNLSSLLSLHWNFKLDRWCLNFKLVVKTVTKCGFCGCWFVLEMEVGMYLSLHYMKIHYIDMVSFPLRTL